MTWASARWWVAWTRCCQYSLKNWRPKDSAENAPSYSLSGTVSCQAQGNPIPYAFGGHDTKGMFVGSAVISGGILAEDQQ